MIQCTDHARNRFAARHPAYSSNTPQRIQRQCIQRRRAHIIRAESRANAADLRRWREAGGRGQARMGTHRGEAGIVASLVVHGLGENSRGISERLVIYGLTIAHPAQGVGIASAVALIPL